MDGGNIIDLSKKRDEKTPPQFTYKFWLKEEDEPISHFGHMFITGAFVGVALGEEGTIQFVTPLDNLEWAEIVKKSVSKRATTE